MTTYVRARTTYEMSAYSDFNMPEVFSHEIIYTTTAQASLNQSLIAGSGGAAVSYPLTQYTTIQELFIYNTDPAINLTVTYKSAGGGATMQTQTIGPGDGIRLVDVAVATALTLTAASATVAVQLCVFGT